MSIRSSARTPGGSQHPHGQVLRCDNCGTDRQLVIRSIQTVPGPSQDRVEVVYICTACELFHSRKANAADVEGLLNRPGRTTSDVLIFGGHYIHCGQPMEKAGSELRRLRAPVSTDRDTENALDVYFATRVLRCPCGFQMELPDLPTASAFPAIGGRNPDPHGTQSHRRRKEPWPDAPGP